MTTRLLDAAGVRSGFQRLLPLGFFVAAFGLAFGLAAAQRGLSDVEALLMSALVFAGASQFAALELWQAEIPFVALAITTFAINSRHLLMGASLYRWMQPLPWGQRHGVLALLSDANWAMAMQDYQHGQRNLGIVLGGGLAIWLAWMLGCLTGLLVTSGIPHPEALGLDMVLSCFLLSMALGAPVQKRQLVIWGVAALAAGLAWHFLPDHTHVVLGALAGGLVGALWLPDDLKTKAA
ncbi:AzlC family ABC transporter permease [Marinospirillum sp. MEB164]|uniref:AzlC family ABC transporter permease n=1 Tax=Marinospirillum alkalitolerans TaxID=3123374 RepID=A0ABW8PUH2_9GAMM